MDSCCIQASAAGRFFSRFARYYGRRYRKSGFEKSQRHLIVGLRQVGIENATVLEIGCGVGFLHQFLLEQGARRSVGIDLSEKMLEEARRTARERGLEKRADYLLGDFLEFADNLDDADISILDKVVCCYPDAEVLITESLRKTRKVFALSYPRDRWFVRAGTALMAGLLWLLRCDFRSYVHDPIEIQRYIREYGFGEIYRNQTPVWLSQVYVRC